MHRTDVIRSFLIEIANHISHNNPQHYDSEGIARQLMVRIQIRTMMLLLDDLEDQLTAYVNAVDQTD